MVMIAADHINELLYPFKSYQVVCGRVHVVRHMGLLDQIEGTITGRTAEGQVFHSAYGSKPAGRLDCIDFIARVNSQSAELAEAHGIDPSAMALRRRLGALSAVLGARPHSRVRSWWVAARVLTQHDAPARSPSAICPSCDRLGTLRVRLDPNVAFCVQCGDTWTDEDTSFGRLAVWVRWSNEHLRSPGHAECDECATERARRCMLAPLAQVCPGGNIMAPATTPPERSHRV